MFKKEGQKVNCYKTHRISLFHLGFGLRTEVTMGHLISDLRYQAYEAYRPSSLLTIKPINHQAYQPLVFFRNF